MPERKIGGERTLDAKKSARLGPGAVLGSLLVAAGLVVAGCRPEQAQSAAQPSSQPADAVPLVLTTPKDAARSVLLCLRALRAAAARHDDQAVAWYRQQLRPMAARDVILRRYQSIGRSLEEDPDALLDRFVQGWAPIIGYYADGLQLDQIKTIGPVTGVTQIDVHVWATSDRGDAVIRLECFRGEDGQWRVARIDFARQPASPPATSPAP